MLRLRLLLELGVGRLSAGEGAGPITAAPAVLDPLVRVRARCLHIRREHLSNAVAQSACLISNVTLRHREVSMLSCATRMHAGQCDR